MFPSAGEEKTQRCRILKSITDYIITKPTFKWNGKRKLVSWTKVDNGTYDFDGKHVIKVISRQLHGEYVFRGSVFLRFLSLSLSLFQKLFLFLAGVGITTITLKHFPVDLKTLNEILRILFHFLKYIYFVCRRFHLPSLCMATLKSLKCAFANFLHQC